MWIDRKQTANLMSRLLILLPVAFLFVILGPKPSVQAIPAFARKYQTSCTTCHNDFPELNDFGEAFKKRGFKFPKDDENFVKEPPVLLGAPALREVFPKVIYPGEIPGSIPISFRYEGFASLNSKRPLNLGFLPRTDLFAPNTFTIIAAGSMGENISFWIDDDISVGGSGANGGLGDAYLKFNDLSHYVGLPRDSINLRFGQFELALPFTQARTINPSGYDIYNQASVAGTLGSTSNPFIFGAPQRGIEIGGYPNDGNFEWAVAVVNGNNTNAAIRNDKDIYVRVANKFNLDRDPKARKEIQAAGATGPRDHTSVRVGGFYYYGRNALNINNDLFPGFGTIREPFYRAGGDVRFKYRNQLEIYGLWMYGRDQNLVPNADTGFVEHLAPVTFSGGFVQAEYWFVPWIIGIARYDGVNSPTDFANGVSRHNTRNRYSQGVQILVRANIKLLAEYQRQFQQSVGVPNQFFRANLFVVGMDFTF